MLTSEQILALSPDDSSAKAAKGLLAPAKWPTLGHNEAAIWGECQGSGSKPYQVVIDPSAPAFKCSCPSRKFPCKHGLALYLLLAQKADAFTCPAPPAWVTEWLGSRQERATKQAEKKEEKAATPADPAASAKRESKRLERMMNGAQDLERWMADLVRQGISDLPTKGYAYWQGIAARLIDAQASGLATAVRQMESTTTAGEAWQQRTLVQMGRTHLLTTALQRLPHLPDLVAHDVRTAVGWPMDKDEVMGSTDRVEDQWLVMGISFDESDRLCERRVWMHGIQSSRQALLLDFSHGQRKFDHGFVVGTMVKSTLAFYPGSWPLRALITDPPTLLEGTSTLDFADRWDLALEPVSCAIGANPWLQRLPLALRHGVPKYDGNRWLMLDVEHRAMPMRVSDADGWQLTALSGGLPLKMFGEWLGERWRPLTAWRADSTQPCWTEGSFFK